MPIRTLPAAARHLIERWLQLLSRLFTELLNRRPATLLGYLVAVAVAGILIALALIVTVTFHLLHRLT